MSVVAGNPNPNLDPLSSRRTLPGGSPLSGDETIDDFVRMIVAKEERIAKRAQLPELAPCEPPQATAAPGPSLLTRLSQRVFSL